MENFEKWLSYREFLEAVDLDLVSKYNIDFVEPKRMHWGCFNYMSLRLGNKIRYAETDDVWRIRTKRWHLTFWKKVDLANFIEL